MNTLDMLTIYDLIRITGKGLTYILVMVALVKFIFWM